MQHAFLPALQCFITVLPREKNLVCFQLVPLVIHSPLLRVMPVWPFLPSFHEEL